jgi:hypothetical protein
MISLYQLMVAHVVVKRFPEFIMTEVAKAQCQVILYRVYSTHLIMGKSKFAPVPKCSILNDFNGCKYKTPRLSVSVLSGSASFTHRLLLTDKGQQGGWVGLGREGEGKSQEN